jgi:predicted pyridoxine 5'-phosphate oxidase superfamily flavin-nucleotide-binding protein
MDLKDNWEQIKATFESGIRTSAHCAIASVGADGYPHITPIGFIFLRDDYSAFYFEEYTQKLPQNLAHNPRVCLLTVNSGAAFWLAALFNGRFASPPGVRLMGVAGERRPATEQEKSAYRVRVKRFRRLRGYKLIWNDLQHVREIKLESFAPVAYPKMTDHLWSRPAP